MAKIFKTALLPVLLATTAASAADMAPQGTYVVQEDYNYFALGVTGGVTVLDLPDVQTGVFSSGDGSFDPDLDSLAIGATFGASMGASIGQVGDHTVFFGLSGFGSFVTASGSATDSFTGRGLVVIPGYNVPADGTITLNTSRGPAAAFSSVIHDNPEGGGATVIIDSTTADDPALASASAVQPDQVPDRRSFSYGAVNVDNVAGDASAYGAIADSSGSLFMGVGDLDGLTIDTSVSQEVIYAGADLTLGMGGPTGVAGNSFQAYAGPSYRYMNQRNTTDILVDIPEIPATTVVHPLYALNRAETIESHYAGAVVGITTSQQFDRFTASLGVEGAAYYQMTSMTGQESVSIYGGAGISDPDIPYPLQVVPQNGISENAEGFAYAVRGQLGLSYAITNNLSIGVAGTAEYLSSVARLDTSTPLVSTDGDANASWVSGLADATPLIAFGEMWAFSGTASVVGRF